MTARLLRGKTAIVTGASRRIGIGAAVALNLAAAGANVFITYYRPYDAEMPWGSQPDDVIALLAAARAFDVRAHGLEFDLAEPGAPRVLFEEAEAVVGPVDILINNATHSVDVSIDNISREQLDRHYAVNVRGMIMMCKEFVRRFSRSHGGRIINITSGQGMHPMPGNLAYAATKGAVDAFTVSLSAEVTARGINVNAIDPGPTDTGWMSPELRVDLEATSPKGRLGQPEDVARLVRFLVSDEAEWITGQIIRSRGGM